MGHSPEKDTCPWELYACQRSPLLGSRIVHPNVQEVKGGRRLARKNRELCKHAKEAYLRWKQGKVAQKTIEILFECAGIGLGKPEPTCSWIWWDTWRATRRASTDNLVSKRKTRENVGLLLNVSAYIEECMSAYIGTPVNIWNLKCILGCGEHWTQEKVVVRAVKLVTYSVKGSAWLCIDWRTGFVRWQFLIIKCVG